MFELIGLAIGGFLGFLAADFLAVLDPLRQTVRQALSAGISKAMQLISAQNSNPLIPIGIVLVIVVIAFWILGFSSAFIVGLVLVKVIFTFVSIDVVSRGDVFLGTRTFRQCSVICKAVT